MIFIDINSLLSGRKNRLDFDICGSVECNDGTSLLPQSMKLEENSVRMKGKVTQTGGYISLEADVDIDYMFNCDRCLESSPFHLSFRIERFVVSDDAEEQDGTASDAGEDIMYYHNGMIDMNGELIEMINLELPMTHLCSEECRGLCPVCGRKIGKDHEGCEVPGAADPRFEILKKLLDN